MGDLHSIAYNGFPSLGCDFHGFEVFNNDISPFSLFLFGLTSRGEGIIFIEQFDIFFSIFLFGLAGNGKVMENTPPFLSNLDCDLSSGYLQDALFKFNSKRRRLLLFNDDDEKENYQIKDSNNSIKNLWSSTIDQQFSEDYDSFSQITKCDSFSGDPMSKMSEEYSKRNEEEAISENNYYSSNSSSTSSSHHNNNHKQSQNYGDDEKRSKKRMSGKIVYPFGLVKPGGQEGDVTLNDINKRILMRPTRPVRHPVGDFACRPTVSPTGPGLSGKTVVALTKIHTQGRGTITIIRTRG